MGTDFSGVGRLLGSPARSAMVDWLLDGRAATAGELARVAGVSASTTSDHLSELVQGGLVTVTSQGRHRYLRLASSEIGTALEGLSQICPALPVKSLRQSREAAALSTARTCYDHLAGALGVDLLDAMLGRSWLVPNDDRYRLTNAGDVSLRGWGIDVAAAEASRRSFARPCVDWTERRPHLGGALGAAIAATLLEQRWLRRLPNGRGVRPTDLGRASLNTALGSACDEDDRCHRNRETDLLNPSGPFLEQRYGQQYGAGRIQGRDHARQR